MSINLYKFGWKRIEHLNKEDLGALEKAIFEFQDPKYIILTTPNKDYNKFFPSLK